MKAGAPGAFAAQLKALRQAAGFTQEELATIAGLSVHAVSALERGERRRPHVDTVRALSTALDLTDASRGLRRAGLECSRCASRQLLRRPVLSATLAAGHESDGVVYPAGTWLALDRKGHMIDSRPPGWDR